MCMYTNTHIQTPIFISVIYMYPGSLGHLLVLPCLIVKVNGKTATKTGRTIKSLESLRIQTWATLPGKESQAAAWGWGKVLNGGWRRQSQTSVTASWLVPGTAVLLAYYTRVYLFVLTISFLSCLFYIKVVDVRFTVQSLGNRVFRGTVAG